MKLLPSQTMRSRMRVAMILLMAFPISSCKLLPGYKEGLVSADEVYMREYLSMMRDGIKKYTSQKSKPPQTLNQLVDEDFMTCVPPDPITHKTDWIIVPIDCSASVNCKKGIKDIHSASTAKSSKGTPYTDW